VTGSDDVDVAIVGLGPVGGVLAALLGTAGHRVLVVERHRTPYQLPRAVHFDHEIARILQRCGLGGEIDRISETGDAYEWRNGAGDVLLRFGGRPTGPSGWPDFNMFWQPALEALIETAASSQPSVEVRRGTRLVDLDDQGPGKGVTVTLSPDLGDAEHQIQARFVVGCDGANSTVRDLIGVPVTDLGFFYDWLIVDVALHTERTFNPINVQICEPSRPTTVVSGGPGRRRWEFMRLPDETIAELDDADRAWELLAPWDVTAGNATLERHAVYRFQARWADRWRSGNVLIAGDAAHQMPPFAGQGMCSGLRDAANLAWKLDLVLAGTSSPDLLDAYEVERRDNVRAVIDFSMALGKVICITDPAEAAERDALMAGSVVDGAATVPPPLPGVTAGIIRAGDDLAGHLFVQGRAALGGQVALLDDVVGAGWRLVSTAADVAGSVPADLADWFAERGGAVVAVPEAADVDGTYARWFAEHGVAVVLQRPDFHLFGTAADVSGAAGLLADLRTALDTPTLHPTPSAGGTP
jgi:2-polyprenyl-6-methoxyphenol hydroxylase-like FAD-dependent oxidoreductase